jgi:hypothetical protein
MKAVQTILFLLLLAASVQAQTVNGLQLVAVSVGDSVTFENAALVETKVYKGTAEVTASTTAVKFTTLPVDCTGGDRTIDPPASPATGDWFAVSYSRIAATNTITIDFISAGQKYYGSAATSPTISSAATVRFEYINSTIGWVAQ